MHVSHVGLFTICYFFLMIPKEDTAIFFSTAK